MSSIKVEFVQIIAELKFCIYVCQCFCLPTANCGDSGERERDTCKENLQEANKAELLLNK